jgi:hypothetical protein
VLFPHFCRVLRAGRFLALVGLGCLLSACATQTPPRQQFDYTAFRQSHPRSILILPPLNASPDVDASPSVLSVATAPLAEAGYYVIPVTLSEETFKQNGVTVASEAHGLPFDRLRRIFGADAALYLSIDRYGVSYRVLESVVEVFASARLVDLRSGREIWQGRTTTVVGSSNGSNDIVGVLVTAIIEQVANSITDRSRDVARVASHRLLSAGHKEGMLYGPYHPKYGTD